MFLKNNFSSAISHYVADIKSAQDYYPGGSLQPGRSFSSNSYRYGYNAGSEKDDEIAGVTGAHFTTYYREFDTRILRPWSPDPVFQPWQSPYSYMDGNPIWFNDPRGDVTDWVEKTAEDGTKTAEWDNNATSPETTQKGDKYLGKTGEGYNAETGNTVYYLENKTKIEAPRLIGEATVDGGQMSDQARRMRNPIAKAVYQGQIGFLNHPITKFTLGGLSLMFPVSKVGCFFASTDAITQYSVTGNVDLISVGMNLLPTKVKGRYANYSYEASKIVVDAVFDYTFSDGFLINSNKNSIINFGTGVVNAGIGSVTRSVNGEIYGKPLLQTITTSSNAALTDDEK